MGVKDSFLGKLLGSADKFTDEQVTQTINLLVASGVKHRASDIHIEPHERFVLVRYRIDGVLRGIHKLPIAAMPSVLRQIKELAHLQPAEDQVPQDGQYATLVEEEQFEVQVSILPIVGGEKIVLHLSRRLSTPPSLEQLGFWGHTKDVLHDALAHSHGVLLVASPRRNGKTTTMHSMAQILNVPAVSIATVEQTLDYRLPGVSQTIARPHRGITFFEGLQAALNQDPNIVMVASLPDTKTANLAVQAGTSGHLVIAGVHADNASAALAHLRTMSDEPYLMSTAARAAISQRLVRQLCVHCRERYIPSNAQVADIEDTFGIASAAARRKIHELEQSAAHSGIDSNKHVNSTPSHITHLWRASDEGCEACNHSGYQGVVAIVEVLEVSDALQSALVAHVPANKLHALALKEGFIPMGLDGLVKALRGVTTVAEVLRTNAVN
jgi:type II secretory ATPase GspE/PulE/Tfp pilus assembly ATPase PilB-like protein